MAIAPSLGHAYALSGKATQGMQLLEKSIAQAVARGSMFGQSLRMGWLAHALLESERGTDARRAASEALDLARRHCERGHEARIHGILGQIVAETDPEDDATATRAYSEQIVIASELQMRPLLANAHLGLARLDLRRGKRRQAQEHLSSATKMYRDMGMQFWLEHAEAATRNVTPTNRGVRGNSM
jgi:hypothetical protein